MTQLFLCPKCKARMNLPDCDFCNMHIDTYNGIYQFTNDKNIKTSGENQYIGYDNIGEHFEPEIIYSDTGDLERISVYSTCADLISQNFGNDITILDLGCGLGSAAIPLAKKGVLTIASYYSYRYI